MKDQLAYKKLKKMLMKQVASVLKISDPASSWPRNYYERAAESINDTLATSYIISEEEKERLGTRISHSTLERILKYGYEIPSPIDKRRLNTLNKLSVYLGEKDWDAFKLSNTGNSPGSIFKKLVSDALEAEFEAYKFLSLEAIEKLKQFYDPDSPGINRIINVVDNTTAKNWTLCNPYNPSYYEVIDINIISIDEDEVKLMTNECWYLKWCSTEDNEVQKIYNEHNFQLYILRKTNSGWKIDVNHYPIKPELLQNTL